MDRYHQLVKKDKNNAPVLPIGCKVLCYKPDLISGKLGINWDGPYYVKTRISKDSYILMCPKTNRTYRRHLQNIRPLKIFDKNEIKAVITNNHENKDTEADITDDEKTVITPKTSNSKGALDLESLFKEENPESNGNWSKRLRPRK